LQCCRTAKLQQLLQFLLQVDGGIRGEGIKLDPHIHITGRRGLVAGGGAEQADALQLVALFPFSLAGTQERKQLIAAEHRLGG